MRYKPEKHHLPPFAENGVILINKPREWTSFDVVNFMRGRFNIPKIGHCGTLDPAATGLLVIVVGKYTKLSEQLSGDDKSYDATVLLGKTSDSHDLDGEITSENDWSQVTAEILTECLKSFEGEQLQTPPMVSAIKKDGRKLCDLARKGIEVAREAKKINITELKINEIALPEFKISVRCSKGTYIRVLAHDIGQKLHCGALLSSLHRTRSGNFSIENAVDLEAIRNFTQEELAKLVIQLENETPTQ